MESKFNHSIKVPNQYKKAAKLLKKTFEEGASIKGQIFEERHARTNRLYALIAKISKHKSILDDLIERTQILVNEPRLDKYICLVLMTELLFGAGKLNGDSKPVQCIRNYKVAFDKILSESKSNTTVNQIANGRDQHSDISKPRYVRINTNLMSRAEALEGFITDGWQEISNEPFLQSYDQYLERIRTLADCEFISDIHVQNLFVFPSSSKRFWARHQLVYESKLILQDKASCLPTHFLNPPKGSVILDMCAAPGMKTSHLAASIKNKGTIYAVEWNDKRYETLQNMVKHTKSTSVHTMKRDALTLASDDVPNVEYILVDPSCSGSGMTDRLFFSTQEYNAERLSSLGGLQIKMLTYAMNTFPMAKKIVYSTCSIFPEENEHVVQRSLESSPNWELIKPIEFAEQWKHFGSRKFKHIGKKCVYARPNVDLTDGFFVAIFQRKTTDNSDDMQHSVASVKNRICYEKVAASLQSNQPDPITNLSSDLKKRKPSIEVASTENDLDQKTKKKRQDKDKAEDESVCAPQHDSVKKKRHEHDDEVEGTAVTAAKKKKRKDK